MTGEKNTICSGFGQSIEPGLWFELKRFRDESNNPLWRIQIGDHISSEKRGVDATMAGLRRLKRSVEEAIEMLRTDGNRLTEEQARASES